MFSPQNMHLEQLGSPTSCAVEPMNVGSPPRSQAISPPGNYLPGFLLGDNTPSHSPALGRQIWPMSKSPSKSRLSLSMSGTAAASPSRNILSPVVTKSSRHLNMSSSALCRPYPARSTTEKHGGPPTEGLFDSLNASSASLGLSFGASTPVMKSSTSYLRDEHTQPKISRSGPLEDEFIKTPASPAQLDPFYSQGEAISPYEVLDESWITVFGFPPAAASHLLQQFSQYGTIIEHRMSSGNWMHLHYQSKLQAKKALSKNGKVFSGSIMVGVGPCIDKEVMDSCKENSANTSLGANASHRSEYQHNSSIRSLTQAYRIAAADHEVTPSGSTPQKATGLVSKSMKYLFGW